jgi:hypothetical protein
MLPDGSAARFQDVLTNGEGDVASRSFEDSSGILWEVFEVKRTSEAPGGVSHGLEKGWLTFVSAQGKRRLAPFPTEWKEVEESELERLCASARTANPPRFDGPKPRIRTPRIAVAEPPVSAPAPPPAETGLVRDVIRVFAQQARRDKTPAIEAMVRLKALLAERYGNEGLDDATRSDLGDLRRIRRWFVEAYYFERPA